MLYYLIVCRSLTFAQRTAAVLERSGIPVRLLRSPREVSATGCSHSVKIAQRNLNNALAALNRAGLSPTRVYAIEGDGSYREVAL